MNAVPFFFNAGYGSSVVRTARDAEYDVFSRVTRMLRQAHMTEDGLELIFERPSTRTSRKQDKHGRADRI